MVISPPFLPLREAGETDAGWFARAMKQQVAQAQDVGALEGSFPVAGQFMWHTGLHLTAPAAPGGFAPVRAIADGKVIHVRAPTPHTADADHPQNYSPALNGARWSDNGCVIVEHTTDIGSADEVPTTFTYYSLTMHLGAIDPAIKRDASVHRKAVIGHPGKCYGANADIHFEVCCDLEQLKKLIGRDPVWVPPFAPVVPQKDGRTDVVFGDLFIYLPATTPTLAAAPKSSDIALRPRTGATQTLGKPQWVRIRYEKGDCKISSLDPDGRPIGTPLLSNDFEYGLYEKAVALHKSVKASVHEGQSCPSAWFELLRYGRNLGPDALPLDAAHWRAIPTVDGTLWADLNAAGTFKFSEGDFLPVAEWNFFSDDEDHLDQRCQSPHFKHWIRDPDQRVVDRDKADVLANRLKDPNVRNRLKRAICKFPTEWDASTIEARNRWVIDPAQTKPPLDQEHWRKFLRHAEAMCLPDLPSGYLQAQWRFHPQEFVEIMGKVGWLSKNEVVRCFERVGVKPKDMLERLEKSGKNDANIVKRPALLHVALQKMLRKYLINTSPSRLAHFIGQIAEETGYLEYALEMGDENYFKKYDNSTVIGLRLGNKKPEDGSKYRGRGLIQLTGYYNYSIFSAYLADPVVLDSGVGRLASDAYIACGVAGFYWVSKQRETKTKSGGYLPNGKRGINYWCDRGVTRTDAEQVTKCVNPAMVHFNEVRWPSFRQALNILTCYTD
ncbi:hypothetical protein GN316_12570 [Xylophilus sp. Kf1]|nr:hypothetical protein [Xylophilus sp. Kf1]